MASFKEYLLEAAKGKKPVYSEVEVKDAIKILNKYCKDALWMLNKNMPLYRADRAMMKSTLNSGFSLADSSLTTRQSENTSNFYTIILDNIPSRKDFPKRSKSFIGSRSITRAQNYGRSNVVIMIPYDGVKIGAVNKDDMWDTKINVHNSIRRIESYNWVWERFFNALEKNSVKKKLNWQFFEKLDKALREKNPKTLDVFNDEFCENTTRKIDTTHFLKDIDDAYSPRATGHTCHTTENLPRIMSSSEVWVEGQCVLISEEMWNDLLRTYKSAKI